MFNSTTAKTKAGNFWKTALTLAEAAMKAQMTTRLMTRLNTKQIGTRDVEGHARNHMVAKVNREGKCNKINYLRGKGFSTMKYLRNERMVMAIMGVKVEE